MFLSIEIDDNKIYIIQASKKGNLLSIYNCISVNIPHTVIDDRIINIECISGIIGDALKRNNINVNKAIFVINSDRIISRKINLPLLKKKQEIISMLRYELNQLIPVDLSQYQLGYKIIEANHHDKNYALYVVYCIPLDLLNKYSELAKILKFKSVLFDVPCNCLNKILQHNLSINKTDILEDVIGFAMLDINKIFFYVLNKGVNDFAISTVLDYNNIEIAAETQSGYLIDDFPDYNNFLHNYIDEISKYIRYYHSIDYEVKIRKLYIYGDKNFEDDLVQFTSETLNMEVTVLKDISNVVFLNKTAEKDFNIDNFFIPLLAAFNDKNDIFFRYERNNVLTNVRRGDFGLFIAASIILILFTYIIFVKGNEFNLMKEFVADSGNVLLNNEIESLKKDIAYMENMLHNIEILKEISDKDDFVRSEIFREIKNSLPQNTQVASISIDRFSTQLNCASNTMEEVTLFLKRLMKIEFVESVYVPSVEVKRDPNVSYSYSVVCVIKEVISIDK